MYPSHRVSEDFCYTRVLLRGIVLNELRINNGDVDNRSANRRACTGFGVLHPPVLRTWCAKVGQSPLHVSFTGCVSPSHPQRISWHQIEFAQRRGQGHVHFHVGERRTNATVHSAAERIAREGVRHGTEVRSGLNDPASRNVCCESWASSILAHTMVSSERIILPAGFASPSSPMRRR
jgi:hypothetical protein